MGRSRRGSGSGFTRTSAAPRSSPPRSSPSARPPAAVQYGAPSMMAPSRAPGLMGTMAAAAGGSLLGNAVAHQLFGAPQPTTKEGVAEMKQAMEQSPCAIQFDMYAKCMEHNAGDASACQWAWDTVAQCRTQALSQEPKA